MSTETWTITRGDITSTVTINHRPGDSHAHRRLIAAQAIDATGEHTGQLVPAAAPDRDLPDWLWGFGWAASHPDGNPQRGAITWNGGRVIHIGASALYESTDRPGRSTAADR